MSVHGQKCKSLWGYYALTFIIYLRVHYHYIFLHSSCHPCI